MITRRNVVTALLTAGFAPWTVAEAAAPSARQTELFAAWHRARRLGAPLLVLVVPDGEASWVRGEAVGGALCEAGPGLIRRLAGYAPACATRDDLRLLGAEVEEDTWFVILDGSVPVHVTLLPPPSGSDDPIDQVAHLLLRHLPEQPPRIAARAEWVDERIPGSYWAYATGCGANVEGLDDGYGYLCGMGSIPERGARFLAFYVSELDE